MHGARPRLHGAEGPHRPRPLPGRVGGDAVLHRGAGGGGLQVGLDPRGQRAVRAAGGVLDPDLHAPGDRLPARDLRRLVPHAHAHRRLGGGVGEVGSRARTRRCSRSSAAGTSARGRSRRATTVFDWDEVRIWSRTQASLDRFLAEQAPKYPHLPDRRARPTCGRRSTGADVIVTGTHARSWLVDDGWVKPGAHIAALGADLKGEQELDPRTLQRARVFVDDIRQCREDGEINVALAEGLITEDDLAGEIGKVICGELEGPAVRRAGDGLRLDRDRAPGLGDGAARVRAGGRSRASASRRR